MRISFKMLVSIFLIFSLTTCKGSEDSDHDSHDHDSDDHASDDHDSDDHDSHDLNSTDHDSHDHDSHDCDCHDHDSHDHDSHDHDSHDHDENTDPTSKEVGNAFLVTMFAGLSTVVGAAGAFCVGADSIDTEHSTFLAGCLSFAAAVMLYVSFVEIWHEALHKFEDVEDEYILAHIYTSLTFFGGIFIGYVTSLLVESFETRNVGSSGGEGVELQANTRATKNASDDEVSMEVVSSDSKKNDLLKAGIVTAFSIAIHNFPEGIVTFFSLIDNWDLGVATAFAIAVHNIPEGISIAIPFYYASEKRWKAFALAFLSGLAEPFGALIGLAIVGDRWGDAAFGTMYGLTAGIMVYISLSQLLPLARKNDPQDKVTTVLLFVGMFVMDLSLYIGGGHEH